MICSIHDVAFPEGGTCWCCDIKEAHPVVAPIPEKSDLIVRVDAPLPPRQVTVTDNQHCGKHDTIFTAEKPCRGCEMEKAAAGESAIKGPDDTLQEFREQSAVADDRKPRGQSSWPAWMAAPWRKKA